MMQDVLQSPWKSWGICIGAYAVLIGMFIIVKMLSRPRFESLEQRGIVLTSGKEVWEA